jgi:hypothetical protein
MKDFFKLLIEKGFIDPIKAILFTTGLAVWVLITASMMPQFNYLVKELFFKIAMPWVFGH